MSYRKKEGRPKTDDKFYNKLKLKIIIKMLSIETIALNFQWNLIIENNFIISRTTAVTIAVMKEIND